MISPVTGLRVVNQNLEVLAEMIMVGELMLEVEELPVEEDLILPGVSY